MKMLYLNTNLNTNIYFDILNSRDDLIHIKKIRILVNNTTKK